MKPSARLGQSGAITLLVAITLVMLASLASFYSAPQRAAGPSGQ
jgi:hypothetical protein